MTASSPARRTAYPTDPDGPESHDSHGSRDATPARPGPGTARPTVALLGEFSAGKSTLANVLLGVARSPVKVTATQVPPIWYVAGAGQPVRIAASGSETALADGDLASLSPRNTRAVRVPLEAPILERVSILDMPGSSDPNMSPDIWDALLPLADIVIWCTAATQAWRQSEAAIWATVPDAVRQRSLLLLTRFDKIAAPDRARVIARVARETAGQFRAVLPVSLLAVDGPPEHCAVSGMAQVMRALARELGEDPGDITADLAAVLPADLAADPPRDATAALAMPGAMPAETPGAMPAISARATTGAVTILPRRVLAGDAGGGARILRRPATGGGIA